MTFRFLPHTADIKFVAYGTTIPSLFNACARAVAHYVLGKDSLPNGKKIQKIHLTGDNHEALLYSFIEELIYLSEVKRLVAVSTRVSLQGKTLQGELLCVPVMDHSRSIKAPTFAEMYVKKIQKRWKAQVVLDV